MLEIKMNDANLLFDVMYNFFLGKRGKLLFLNSRTDSSLLNERATIYPLLVE